MKIGIFGGSFDPIHTGHAMLANFISQCNIVDQVWLTVSRKNPLKEHSTYATERQRVEMVKLVAAYCSNVEVCLEELNLPYPSYTYNTLCHLQKLFPQNEFKIIIGSDNLSTLHQWKESEKILQEFGVIVYPRPGYPLKGEEPSGMKYLNGAPEFSISSSLIREYISSKWNINYFVPLEVAEYIKINKLYL
ncbi:MAG: nicotinate (nicotinamide) nucleotide adenylyltransferase [Muribaculaceae bacterium]|nr:nicotinate (nicotinamide) nucleotide adenylyltransferase [Muribaculaceae bacterium]